MNQFGTKVLFHHLIQLYCTFLGVYLITSYALF